MNTETNTKRSILTLAAAVSVLALVAAGPAAADLARAKKFGEFTPAAPDGWSKNKPHTQFTEKGISKGSLAFVTYAQKKGGGSLNLQIKDVVMAGDRMIVTKPQNIGFKATEIKGLKSGFKPCGEKVRSGGYRIITGKYLVVLTCARTSNDVAMKLLNGIDYKAIAAVK